MAGKRHSVPPNKAVLLIKSVGRDIHPPACDSFSIIPGKVGIDIGMNASNLSKEEEFSIVSFWLPG